MTRFALVPLAAGLLLAGCVQSYASPVSVTRFLGDAPARLGQGSIAVRPAPGLPTSSLQFSPYAQAVSAELSRVGYQLVAGNDGAQVADIAIARAVDVPGRARNPVSVGVGGSTGGYYGSGVGAGIGIDLTRPPPDLTTTQMTVTIRDGASGRPLWEGRAEFTASSNSQFGSAQAAAAKMAAALFARFPGRSGETTEVR
jgi:hypothetical protein